MKSKMVKIVVAGVALGALTLVTAVAAASSVDTFGGTPPAYRPRAPCHVSSVRYCIAVVFFGMTSSGYS